MLKWTDKQNGIDDVSAEDINIIARAVIELENAEEETNNKIGDIETALDNIKARSGDLITTEKKYSWVKALSDTAIGNIH